MEPAFAPRRRRVAVHERHAKNAHAGELEENVGISWGYRRGGRRRCRPGSGEFGHAGCDVFSDQRGDLSVGEIGINAACIAEGLR